MNFFTDWGNESGQRRYCPDCHADLWIRSCGHFPMGGEGDAMRNSYVNQGELPDPKRVSEIIKELHGNNTKPK